MRIALVTPEFISEEFFDGGLANYIHRLALSLKNMGHNVVIVVTASHDESMVWRGLHVERVAVWQQGHWGAVSSRFLRRCDRLTLRIFSMSISLLWQSRCLCKRVNFLHRTHAFDVAQYAHLAGVGLLRNSRIPAVVRLSSSTKLCQEKGGYGAPNWDIAQQRFIENFVVKRADIVFGPSERIAELTTQECGVPVRVIESPFLPDVASVDDSVYRAHLHGVQYLLFFGSIGLIKGVGTIAEIIHAVLCRYPELRFAFVGKRLPGQDGGDLMDRVMHNAAEHVERVLWIPSQPHEKLYPIIAHAHAVILPSRIDNFPNSCIEAMALERVVVGTKGNGFEQLIVHGESGFLAAPDDAAGLLAMIGRVMALSSEECRVMGKRAEGRIRLLHPENTVAALLDCYLDAMEMHQNIPSSPQNLCVAFAE